MKKILLIGIFLLVATLGLNVASAAELNNNTVDEVLSVEQESMNVESISQESVNQESEEKSTNTINVIEDMEASRQLGLRNPTPFDNKNPNPFNNINNNNTVMGGGVNTTNDIHKINDTNTDCHPNNDSNKAVGIADLSKVEPPKEPTIIKKSKTFEYKGEKVYLAIIDNNDGKGQKLVCFKASGSLNGAGGSVVSETGADLVKLLEDTGAIKKWGHCAAWLSIKCASLFYDIDEYTQDWIINYIDNDGDLKIFF